jgi:hypothetical protein
MVGAMVAAMTAAAALPHHRHSSTLKHTLITSTIMATAKAMRMVGCCVITHLLAHFCSLCSPCLYKLMLSPHPTDTLRGNNCFPPDKKAAKREATVSFLRFPLTSNISPFIFSIKLLFPDELLQSLLQRRIPLP